MHDVKRICGDPGPPFEADRIRTAGDFVLLNAAGAIYPLFESNQPGRSPAPVTQPLASHLEIVALVGMENKRQRGQSSSGDLVGKILHPGTLIAKLADIEEPGARLGNGR